MTRPVWPSGKSSLCSPILGIPLRREGADRVKGKKKKKSSVKKSVILAINSSTQQACSQEADMKKQ